MLSLLRVPLPTDSLEESEEIEMFVCCDAHAVDSLQMSSKALSLQHKLKPQTKTPN